MKKPRRRTQGARRRKQKPYPDKNLIKGALRRLMARSPVTLEVKNNAAHATIRGPRGGKQYVCNVCNVCVPGSEIQVDHLNTVVPLDKTIDDMDYNELVARIFCDKHNLQAICINCHKAKSNNERKERKRLKDEIAKAQKDNQSTRHSTL